MKATLRALEVSLDWLCHPDILPQITQLCFAGWEGREGERKVVQLHEVEGGGELLKRIEWGKRRKGTGASTFKGFSQDELRWHSTTQYRRWTFLLACLVIIS